MRGQDNIIQALQGGGEGFCIGRGFDRKYVNRCACQMAGFQGVGQGIQIHDRAARIVDEITAWLHLRKLRRPDHILGLGRFRDMQ